MLKNILTVYKMNLPFGEGSYYDKTKYNSIIKELIWLFKYEWIYVKEKKQKFKKFELSEINFEWWIVKIIFYYEKKYIFLPSFQVDLYSKWKLDQRFLKNFYEIFINLWLNEYIFDLISEKIEIKNIKILTDYKLANYFKNFSQKKLEIFFNNLDINFVEEKLEQNLEIKYQLYYLIFLNYKLFKNILLSKWGINDLEKLIWSDIDDSLKLHLFFSKEKIEFIWDINILVFKKYKEILENFLSKIKET